MDKWEAIKLRSGVDIDLTFKLSQAVSDEMGMILSAVLIAFGEWWIDGSVR